MSLATRAIDGPGLAKRSLQKSVLYVLAYGLGIVFLIPFIWMLSTSVKPSSEVFIFPPKWIPSVFQFDNYRRALIVDLPFVQYFINTIEVTLLSLIGDVLSCSLVAFGFARLRFPGRDTLFLILLSTLMVPYHVTMIPRYLMFRDFHWLDTYYPLIVPSYLAVSAFFIFLLRQFFLGIPLQLDRAARMDGCGTFDIYWRIVMPLARPALVTVTVLSFIGTWNDFLTPMIYLSSDKKFLVSLGLRHFVALRSGVWNELMAASIAVMIPCLIIFFVAQRAFIQGTVVSGVKG
jgi:ABC-type glycerol-3-phosphate transport system permease component